MEYQVTLQVKGEDLKVGTLYVNARRGIETSSFRYDPSYLADRGAVPISPDLPLVDGSIHSQGQTLFGAFEDSMPDRWGRNLMLRAEKQAAKREARAQRTLLESDYLVGVSDEARQGALRIWVGEKPVAQPGVGVPREVNIPDLLAAADRASADINADVSDLIAAGSSLGGARPKASVVDEKGYLCIAKFPKAEESSIEDVCAWEKTALDLAGEFGIKVPVTRLLRVAGRSVLLLRRFDRNEKGRIHYISGMTAVQGADGGRYSYLDLVSFIEGEGSYPREDIIELWKRVLFSCAVGNIDDHMRNHGFLNAGGGWCLSPLFDVNPTPGSNTKYLRSTIDYERDEALPEVAVDACEWYRLSRSEACAYARGLAKTLARWERVANANGISRQSRQYMADCFNAAIDRLGSVR